MELPFDETIAIVFVVRHQSLFFALMIGDGEDKRYAKIDTKHFVSILALNILCRAVYLRVKLFIIFY